MEEWYDIDPKQKMLNSIQGKAIEVWRCVILFLKDELQQERIEEVLKNFHQGCGEEEEKREGLVQGIVHEQDGDGGVGVGEGYTKITEEHYCNWSKSKVY